MATDEEARRILNEQKIAAEKLKMDEQTKAEQREALKKAADEQNKKEK